MLSFRAERKAMKTIAITIAALLSVFEAVAQQDTISGDSSVVSPKPGTDFRRRPEPQARSEEFRSNDAMIRVRADALPLALKRRLEADTYKGWENSPVYIDRKTDEYSIGIPSGDTLRTFRFDRFGNPVNPHTPIKDQ